MTTNPNETREQTMAETLISHIHCDETIVTDCDNDCRQRATHELTLHIPDDSTGPDDTTIEYTCDDHLRHYTNLPTTLDATTQLELRLLDLAARIRHHLTTNDFDTTELRHMATLLDDYSHALTDAGFYACYELADDLLAATTDDHLTNGVSR
jgi:hypothetical protein